MSLRARLGAAAPSFTVSNEVAGDATGLPTRAYHETKARIHQVLLGRIDLEAMESLSPENLKEELRQMVERLLVEENLILNAGERRNLVRDIQYEMLGLGPLEPLLADPTVSDILVNTHKQVYVERRGRLETDRHHFRRRRASDEDHRQDRFARRPPRRRVQPDGRRAPARRLARQRDHPAAGARRPDPVDPPLLGGAAADREPDRVPARCRTEMAQLLAARCPRPRSTS